MLVLEGLVGVRRTIQLQLLQHYWLGHRLGLRDIEKFALDCKDIKLINPKKISPEYSLKGLTLMLKLQYFGYLM